MPTDTHLSPRSLADDRSQRVSASVRILREAPLYIWRPNVERGSQRSGMDAEIEEVHQVTDSWTIGRDVRITLRRGGVGEVVAAATADRGQVPVLLDELQDRNVVCVVVRDVAG